MKTCKIKTMAPDFIKVILLSAAILTLAVSFSAVAAGGAELEHSGANVNDVASLQRGAKWYVNYCLSCHSLDYMRYNRMAEDLRLSEEEAMQNLVFSDAKFPETMSISMDAKQSEAWFGTTPPDLSLVGRSRGPDWVYSYLLGFYKDESGGWNNTVLANAAMPHVLWRMQGIQTPVFRQETTAEGYTHDVIDHFELTTAGTQSVEEYKQTARDLAAFLEYVGEPAVLQRKSLGVWVILFLVLFTFVAYLLKVEYWRDIH